MLYYHRGTSDLFRAAVDLGGDEVGLESGKVEIVKKLEEGFHAQADIDEILEMRDVCLADERVGEEVRRYGLPEGMRVVCDTW